MGLDPVVAPLFTVEPVAWEPPEPTGYDAVLLTSANAVRHGGEGLQRLRGLPVHAVGAATAEAAREAGFDVASTGKDDVDRLLGSLEADLKLLHLCGEDRREPSRPRQEITALPVYRAAPLDATTIDDLAGQIAAVHSPRAATRLAELVEERAAIALAAISDAAASAAGNGWQHVAIAAEPTDAALLATAAELCEKP
jgi:uroporphyrinogen-III synthase